MIVRQKFTLIIRLKQEKMSEQDIPLREQTKVELMRRNQRAYDDIQSLISPLDDEQLSQPGSSGWAIKHHQILEEIK
jgi:hypothetical protein